MKKQKINPLHLDQQLCFALYSTTRLLVQSYDFFLKDLKLTYPQYLVMLVLWQTDEVSVKEIGHKLFLDSGTLSPLLKKLEDKKYLKKIRSIVDERLVCVALTSQGKALEKKAAQIPTALFCKLEMSEKEYYDLKKRLSNLTITLKKGLE